MRIDRIIFLYCLASVSSVHASPAGIIEAGHKTLRSDLEWLSDRGVLEIDSTSWPLPVAELERAIKRADTRTLSTADEIALRSVRNVLAHNQKDINAGLFVELRNRRTETTDLEHPVRARQQAGFSLGGNSGALAGRLAVQAMHDPLTSRQRNTSFEGSYVAGNLGNQLFYAGQVNHAWGPGQSGSLVWSNAATPIPGIGLKRATHTAFDYPVLKHLGDWGYEIFIGELQNAKLVPDTKVLSMRVHIQPTPSLQLGASRLIHWGGKIGKNSFSEMMKAFFSGSRNSNLDGSRGTKNNEIAGFDASWKTRLYDNPLTLYGQLIGEDEAGYLPYKYIALGGISYKFATAKGRWSTNLEYADTMTDRFQSKSKKGVAYNHSQYKDGMYHEGLPIAYFMGGDARVSSFGVEYVPSHNHGNLRYRTRFVQAETHAGSSKNNLAWPEYDKFKQVDFDVFWRRELFGNMPVETNFSLGLRDSKTHSNSTFAGIRINLEL